MNQGIVAASDLDPRSVTLLKWALGIIYLHFGLLKFFPQLSPAEILSTETIMALTGHLLTASQSLFLLALMETVLGLGFLLRIFPRATFVVFTLHMLGTLTPLVLLPEFTFKVAPFAPTLEGQYILKNLVFLAAGWAILLPDAWPRTVPLSGAEAPAVSAPGS